MLSGAGNLEECEAILKPLVQQVNILAEILLDEDDVRLLADLIRTFLRHKPRKSLETIVRNYAASFACFMTWKAKTSYSDGSFWPPILSSLGLSDESWDVRLGKAFDRCLEEMRLPTYEVPGSNRYVTAILMHGGIPDSCVDCFFREVVSPLIRDGITEPGAIRLELEVLRKDDSLYRQLDYKEKELRSAINDVDRKLCLIKNYIETKNTLARLNEEIENSQPNFALSDICEKENLRVGAAVRIRESLSRLLNTRERLVGVMSRFTPADKDLIGFTADIQAFAGLWRDLERLKTRYATQADVLKRTECDLSSIARAILGIEWSVDLSEKVKALPFEELEQAMTERDHFLGELASNHWISGGANSASTLKPPYPKSWLWTARVGTWFAALSACAGFLTLLLQGSHSPFLASRLGLAVVSLALAGAATVLRVWSGNMRKELGKFNHLAEAWTRSISTIQKCLREIVGVEHFSGQDFLLARKLSHMELNGLKNMVSLIDARDELVLDLQLIEKEIGEIQKKIKSMECLNPFLTSVPAPDHICLGRRLREARLRQSEAESSAGLLATSIDPELKVLFYSQLYLLLGGLTVFREIEAFGDGDFQEGLQRLERLERLKADAKELAQQLKTLRAEIDKIGIDPEKVTEEDYIKQRSRIVEELAETIREKNKYSPAFGPWVDEPVARYVLFAGDSAFRFLLECIRMVLSNGNVRSLQESDPYQNLARRSYEIWTSILSKRGTSYDFKAEAYQLRAPQIIFRGADCTVCIKVPEQRLPLERASSGLVLQVAHGQTKNCYELAAFKEDSQWCRTGYLEVPVCFPGNCVSVSITARNASTKEPEDDIGVVIAEEPATGDHGVLPAWTLQLPGSDKPVSFFRDSDGLEITGEISHDTVWAVLAPAWRPSPGIRVLEEVEMAGGWSGYKAFLLDLTEWNSNDACFVSNDGTEKSFRMREKPVFRGPYLEGEMAPFFLNGERVYLREFPAIVFEASDDIDLSDWHLYITKVVGMKHVQVGGAEPGGGNPQDDSSYQMQYLDVASMSFNLASLYERTGGAVTQDSATAGSSGGVEGNGEGRIRIPLRFPELEGSDSVNSFNVRLLGPRRKRFLYSFSVISDACVEFDPHLVGPYEDRPGPVKVTMILPEDVKFYPEGSIIAEDLEPGFAQVIVESDKKSVEGTLYAEGRRTYKLHLPIPRVSVRLEGEGIVLEGSGQLLQVSMKQLAAMKTPRLSISVHAHQLKSLTCVAISLKNTSQTIEQRVDYLLGNMSEDSVEHGSFTFELAGFFDSLREQSEGMFLVAFYSGDRSLLVSMPVLRVFTRWLVKDLRVTCRVDGDELLSDLEWTETGSEDEREIKLWPVHTFWSGPVEVPVPVGKNSIRVRMNPDLHPPGLYLVQFETGGNWDSGSPSKSVPLPGGINVFRVNIAPGDSDLDAFGVNWSSGEVRGPGLALSPGRDEPKCVACYLWSVGIDAVLESLKMNGSAEWSSGSLPSDRLNKTIAVAVYSNSLHTGIIQVNPSGPFLRLRVDEPVCKALLESWDIDEFSLVLVPSPERTGSPSNSSASYGIPGNVYPYEYRLNGRQARHLLESAIAHQETELKLRFTAGEYEVPVQLYADGSGKMRMVNGVRCVSCNTYFPNQSEFYRHAYTCKGGAKKLKLNCNDAPFVAYVEWKPFRDVFSPKLSRSNLKDDLPEFFTLARWCTEKVARKWLSVLSDISGEELTRVIFWTESERRKALKKLGLL